MVQPSHLASPRQQEHHRGCYCALPGPASAGQKEEEPAWLGKVGREPSVGQRALDVVSGLCVGYLPAYSPLLGQSQEEQGRSQERKGRGLAYLVKRGDTASLGPGSHTDNSTSPLGPAALIPKRLDRLNIPRDERISFGSCGKTKGTGRGWDTRDPASPRPVLPLTME